MPFATGIDGTTIQRMPRRRRHYAMVAYRRRRGKLAKACWSLAALLVGNSSKSRADSTTQLITFLRVEQFASPCRNFLVLFGSLRVVSTPSLGRNTQSTV